MQFEAQYTIRLPHETLWEVLMDVHKVAECIEGVSALEVIEPDHYAGSLTVKMGPVKFTFEGVVNVTLRDRENWRGVLEATAKDPKAGGGFKANLTMVLIEQGATSTQLDINLETTFLGRIGELGRPLIKKKIANMMTDFVNTLDARHVTGQGESA